ncbi:alpha/beta hydrolase [Bradyrhizobium sp. SSBR45G]|uniref:alpha/beta hydrolase n=1 Tax=unclassified Bradyrhizobium TaxID=2631580 RepID=UPI0023429291|nr:MULTISPECIES: alpha/beta fold hydrolase [unclassified Bradyrhizobium]GLH76939.1 alpha/beta hydrolase [Bradyrhizobium sp. SSBR45G]GLH83697.1 alpha/beta hydrolase [Bradyrhizobium sp. SSBR45R]
MRAVVICCTLALALLPRLASAEESALRVGAIDAILTTPPGIERPPVALLIAGSGSTDRDGNGPQLKPATLKKLAEQLAARGIASLRYDKRGARGWKAEFGRPEDFRFKDYVDDAASLVDSLRGKFARIVLVGHSEGGLVAILTARRTPVDRLVLLAASARRQGDLLKTQLEKKLPAAAMGPVAKAIDAIMAGQVVDPPPPELPIAPIMQPGIGSAFAEDPIDPLKQIVIPILLVGGAKDSQIARLDMVALAAAAPAAKSLWLPEMNHVLVDVANEDENLSSYNDPDRPLDPDMVDAVAGFIAAAGPR